MRILICFVRNNWKKFRDSMRFMKKPMERAKILKINSFILKRKISRSINRLRKKTR